METSKDKEYLKLSKLYVTLESKSNFKEKYLETVLQEEGDINYQLTSSTALGSMNPELVGCTALNLAYKKDQIKIFNLLLKNGADCTIENHKGLSVLHEIITDTCGKSVVDNAYLNSILETYIDRKTIFKWRNKNNLTFFHAACISGKLSYVKSCLRISTRVDQLVEFSNFEGYTSLHLAVQYCKHEIIEILLKYQPNLNHKNARKLTPLQMVFERHLQSSNENSDDEKIIGLLLKDKTNIIDEETGLSLLHIACTMKSTSTLEHILPTLKDVDQIIHSDSPIFAGNCPLHFAALCSLEAVKLLMRKGANILLKNSSGQTPFDLCMERYEVKDIHEILSIQPLFQNLLLTNGLRFLDLILAMDGHDPHQFHLQNNLTSIIYVGFNSPLWPGYSILHVAVMFAEKKCSSNNNLAIKQFLNPKDSINTYIQYTESPLHLAFRLNKTFAVHELLNHPNLVSTNITNQDGLTFLHIVCAAGNQEILNDQMLNKIEVNRQLSVDYLWRDLYIPKGATALHIAVIVGNCELVKILMNVGADPYIKDANGMTPIHWLMVSNNSSKPIVDLLLTPSPLAEMEFVPVVSKKRKRKRKKKNSILINNSTLKIPGSVVEITANNGLTHLHVASFFGNVKIVEKLRQSGSNVNAAINHNLVNDVKKFPGLVGFAGYTALNLAMKNNHQNVVRLLLLNGANILLGRPNGSNSLLDVLLNQPKNHAHPFICIVGNSKKLQNRIYTRYGLKMLHLYCYAGDIDSVKISFDNFEFVDNVIDKNSPIWPGFTPLHVAVKHYVFNGLLQMLLDRNADVTKMDVDGCTPIHLVYYSDMNTNDKIQLMSLLMKYQKKYKTNPTDKKGLSHFHIACALVDLNVMKEFLKHDVDVNKPVDYFHDSKLAGCSALHLVLNPMFNESVDTAVKDKAIKSLIKHGANIHAKDTRGNTPLHFAAKCEPQNIMDLMKRLLEAGARIDEENIKGQTIFEVMLKSTSTQMSGIEYEDLIAKFLKLSGDINHQDRLGRTPLHIATQFRNHQGIIALLNAGANVNIVDISDKTAFAYAVEESSLMSATYGNTSKEIVQTFAYHLQKLNLCLLDVHETNHKILAEASQNYAIDVNLPSSFSEQLMMLKSFKIDKTELTLFDFISETKAVVAYSTLPRTQRLTVDKYFESIDVTPLTELIGIVRLQYRKALAKQKSHA